MSLNNYSEIETIFESNNTVLKKGRLNDEFYIFKAYKDVYTDSYRKEKILKESEIQNKLNGGNSDIIYDQGIPTLIRPFYEGITLAKFVKFWDFEIEHFINIALSIAEDLQKLHKLKIVHLDLNPSNIIYDTISKKCKIIDFGSAQFLKNKNTYLGNPERIECDLCYISPEQTGRINRTVDFRSDLYSLGVIMYLLSTESLPFNCELPLELVHSHIAKKPAIPSSLNSSIPEYLDNIILKLLSKNAEDRYNTDAGLIFDLKHCLKIIGGETTGEGFIPGSNDLSDRFRISQKTYGRNREIGLIAKAYDRCTKGQKELVLIEGKAGTGKSNLVAENHKILVEKNALFIEGKFDQVNRNIPFSAWVQAFNNFVELLLTENPDELNSWCNTIKEKVGKNISYLSQIFPSIKWLVDDIVDEELQFVPETQNRFRIAVEGFIQAISEKTPLVIFLDDWQWSDLGSVELLKFILESKSINNILIITAYRDNEMSRSHFFNKIHTYLEEPNDLNHQILKIGKLSPNDTLELLHDTLKQKDDGVGELNDLIFDRTEGNALFYVQFLQTIADESYIHYDTDKNKWVWDINEIKRSIISEDIISLLLQKVLRFNEKEQDVLKKAAAIGSRFNIELLTTLCNLTERELEDILQQPMDEGMITQESSIVLAGQDSKFKSINYKFTHDRIQQGVYNNIPDEERLNIHYEIGKYLLKNLSVEERNKSIFSLVSHLNKSSKLISQEDEVKQVVEINLQASNKAKILYDLNNAFEYACVGIDILDRFKVNDDQELRISLYLNRYQLGFYIDKSDQLDIWEQEYLSLGPNKLNLIRFQNVKLRGLTSKGQFGAAIKEGLHILELNGYKIKENPNKLDIIKSFVKTSRSYKKDKIHKLKDLPIMEDPFLIEISNSFMIINAACYFSNNELWAVIISEVTRLYIKNGIAPYASITFGSYASLLIIANKDIKSGIAFGKVSLTVPHRFPGTNYLNQTLFIYHALINWWEEPLNNSIDGLNEAMHLSRSVGDLQFVGHSAVLRSSYKFETGCKLSELKESIFEAQRFIEESQEIVDLYLVKIYGSRTLSLIDSNLMENGFNSTNYEYEKAKDIHLANNQTEVLCAYHLNRGIVSFYARNFEEAYKSISNEEDLGGTTSFGTYNYFCFRFFKAMVKAKIIQLKNPGNKSTLRSYISKLAKEFKAYSKHAPQNFEAKYYLLEAELATLKNKFDLALKHYNKAIESSLKYDALQEEVLAWENAAELLKKKGLEQLFKVYIKNTYIGYTKWGAHGIISRLESNYPWLKKIRIPGESDIVLSSSSSSSLNNLDLSTVVKASEVISQEIDKEKLLKKLIMISIENAAAESGYLILNKDNKLFVSAYGDVHHHTELYDDKDIGTFEDINSKIINYVVRTEKPYIVQDASTDVLFTDDSYIKKNRSKSIFCLPILNKSNLVGLLYLTNNLTTDAFSSERVNMLNVLSGQIAISIENSSLVENLEEKVKLRTIEINKEKETSENLLLNILPKMIASELKHTGRAEPRYYESVSVMFIDFVNFSSMSNNMDYRDLVDLLSEYFQAFDEIISGFEIEKIKTIGDAYLCASGLPLEANNHAHEMLKAAIKIRDFILNLKKEKEAQNKPYFMARIGIHSGPVVAGVVGSKKFAYDIWGSTVNIAARVETSGTPGEIAVSQKTYELIKDEFSAEYKGKYPAKNMVDLDIYTVTQ